jgi:hypothetical protein
VSIPLDNLNNVDKWVVYQNSCDARVNGMHAPMMKFGSRNTSGGSVNSKVLPFMHGEDGGP